jgi:hypothetical protein
MATAEELQKNGIFKPGTNHFAPGNPARWEKGMVVNPAGKPEGTKNKLTSFFFRDLLAAWEEMGVDAIRATAISKPAEFVKIVASLMPKEFAVRAENVADMTDVDLEDAVEVLRSIAEKNRMEKENKTTKILLGDGTTIEHSRPK